MTITRVSVDSAGNLGNGSSSFQLINGLTFGQLSIYPGINGTLIGVASSGEVLAFLTGVPPYLIGPKDFISG